MNQAQRAIMAGFMLDVIIALVIAMFLYNAYGGEGGG